jgi:alanine racemase
LPPCGAEELEALVEHRLTGTLVAVNQLHDLAHVAQSRQRAVTCHVYMDTGLSRLGSDDSLPDLLDALRAFPIVSATGIYSHQGPPGSGVALADLETLREGGAVKGFLGLARNAAAQFAGQQLAVHLAASRLFLEDPNSHADLVRLGTLLYGQYPDDVKARPLQLREDTFSLRSRIIAVQTVETGARIGYGGEFVTRRETRVGTIPVGIAHGLEVVPRSVAGRLGTVVRTWQAKRAGRRGGVSGAPVAKLAGQPAPLLGRVSMDQCCVDLTDLPEVGVGAEVALPARRLMVSASVPRVAVEDPA